MIEFTKDDLLLLNGIMNLALAEGIVQKTDGILALQNKLKADLKEKMKIASNELK